MTNTINSAYLVNQIPVWVNKRSLISFLARKTSKIRHRKFQLMTKLYRGSVIGCCLDFNFGGQLRTNHRHYKNLCWFKSSIWSLPCSFLSAVEFIFLFLISEYDPCSVNNGGCQHVCRHSTVGHFSCSCYEGFELHPNRRDCIGKPTWRVFRLLTFLKKITFLLTVFFFRKKLPRLFV